MSNRSNEGANPALTSFCASVKKDLEELAKLGVSVPAGALKRAEDEAAMEEYQHMRVSDCADLLISLESMGGQK